VHDDGLDKYAPKIAWWPILTNHFEGEDENARQWVVFAIRTPRAGSASLIEDIRRALWAVDSSDKRMRRPFRERRILVLLWTGFYIERATYTSPGASTLPEIPFTLSFCGGRRWPR